MMLINGKPGCGKTSLGASIVERLQRPLARKAFNTIYCSISATMPTQATTINVAKSILYQLLNQRCGNVRMFQSLLRAHERARRSATSPEYESHLWEAIGDALKNPFEKAAELVLIIDGLDEISTDENEASRLYDQLYRTVTDGKSSRLIVLSQSSKLLSQHQGP